MAVPPTVWARAAWAVIDLAEMGGLPSEGLFEGVPFDATSVRKLKRVTWDEYCMLVENVGRLAGDGLDDLLEATYHQALPEVRAIAGALLDSKHLLRFFVTVANPIFVPPIQYVFEDLGDRDVRVICRLSAGARPCETWFRGSIGAIRGVPRYLNLPPAIVSGDFGPDFGIYSVHLPEPRTLGRRISSKVSLAFHSVLGIDDDGTPIAATIGEIPRDSVQGRLEARIIDWKLTPRQGEVLKLVARGDANKDIANTLGCAESTVELHVTQILRKTSLSSRSQLIARVLSES